MISLPAPSGYLVNTSLPAGEYDFMYQRADGEECYYTASIIGMCHTNTYAGSALELYLK